MDTLDSLQAQHEGGKLRLLATSGEQRSLPDVSTFKEAGLALSASGWNALFTPAAMPAAKVRRLAEEVARLMAEPGLRAKFEAARMVPVSAGLAPTRAMLKAYQAQWAPVVKKSGFNPN
ncbi:hypothetical protein G8A07_02600 [Roseateles sp. DAIF2]|uniref:Bug family tripartite tricarboxylate transporter substrate binding protein n=1 Tax=Roseateles sp. DAIF2 TaxID=2714952 RepID=UPI0018A260F3|nr:tripartite tricarboxylate transporter substrate-binding protein [Roseateles sp. DAIF2]QPF71925.1 hypothetical protein G8A07_02600 [Roseateles sp. DAIF2]